MLPFNWHRRFAKKRASENRERRLLAFADVPNENNDPLQNHEHFAGAGINEDGTRQNNPESTVQNETDETRENISDTLTNPQNPEGNVEHAQPVRYDSLLGKIQKTQDKLHVITRNQNSMRNLIRWKIPAGPEKEKHIEDLEKIILFTEMAQKNLLDHESAVLTVQRFTDGFISPADFEKEFLERTSNGLDHMNGFDAHSIAEELASIDSTGMAEPERSTQRTAIFNRILESDPLQTVARFIDEELSSLEKTFESIEDYGENLKDTSDGKEDTGFSWHSLWEGMTSIKNIINGTKKYIEAITKSFEEWNQIKDVSIAQKIGKALSWIPLGEQTESVLARQIETLNDGIRDEEKKGLESMKPSFSMIIGMLNQSKSNPHRFRALLEYAAERAWLYNYDPIRGVVFNINIRSHLPKTWNEGNKEEYLRDLNNKNGSGESSEKKRGYDLVDTDSDIAPIIDTLHDELRRGNYWASHGILQRAMEKGKEGETSTWISITIFRFLRDYPDVKKYFPIKLLDDLGSIGIGHPAWTSTYFKMDRKAIAQWQKGFSSFEDAGALASVISKIEDHINSTGYKTTDQKEYDRYVARILATQTVKINGQHISIFDDRYDEYRNNLENAPTNVDPKTADEDFFNYKSGGSEMILLGNQSYNNMLKIESYGAFVDQYRSNALLEQIIFRADNLEETFGTQSKQYANHISKTKNKLTYWLKTSANDDKAAQKIANNTFQDTGKLIFMTLIKKGLLDLKSVLALGATTLGPIIVRQLLEDSEKVISGREIMQIIEELKSSLEIKEGRYKEIKDLVNLYGG